MKRKPAPAKTKKKTSPAKVKKAVKAAPKHAPKAKAAVKKTAKPAAKKIVKKTVKKAVKEAPVHVKKIAAAKKAPAKKPVAAHKPAPVQHKAPVKVASSAKIARPKLPLLPSAKSAPAPEAMTAAEIREIKKELSGLREEVLKRIQAKKDIDMPEAEVGDPIDQASQSIDKELFFEINDNDQKMLEQIEAALRRIEKGVYGVCESCRQPIPKKRLKAMIFARYCINCQSYSESSVSSIQGLE